MDQTGLVQVTQPRRQRKAQLQAFLEGKPPAASDLAAYGLGRVEGTDPLTLSLAHRMGEGVRRTGEG